MPLFPPAGATEDEQYIRLALALIGTVVTLKFAVGLQRKFSGIRAKGPWWQTNQSDGIVGFACVCWVLKGFILAFGTSRPEFTLTTALIVTGKVLLYLVIFSGLVRIAPVAVTAGCWSVLVPGLLHSVWMIPDWPLDLCRWFFKEFTGPLLGEFLFFASLFLLVITIADTLLSEENSELDKP